MSITLARRRGARAIVVAVTALMIFAVSGCSTAAVVPGRSAPAVAQPAEATALPVPTVAAVAPSPEPSPTPAPPTPAPPVCTQTTMSVWAHPDDDLLFLQSLIARDIGAGGCVRTVFLTSGDAGRPTDYLVGRETAIMRAYDVMRGGSSPWIQESMSLASGAQVVLWSPEDDSRLSIVFFRLPDGNLTGQGYPSTGEISLAQLAADKIPAIPSVGNSYRLTWQQVVDSVRELIHFFAPSTFYTHVPGSAYQWAKGDHADHAITGVLARRAWQDAGLLEAQVSYAVGYQTVNYPANVHGDDLTRKLAAFRAYAAGDPVVMGCQDDASCLNVPRFGAWLQRQYTRTEAELWQ